MSLDPTTPRCRIANPPSLITEKNAANTFSTGTQTIQAGLASTKPLVVQGAASQSASLQEWQDSTSSAVASLSASGDITANSLSVNQAVNGAAAKLAVATIPGPPSVANATAVKFQFPGPGPTLISDFVGGAPGQLVAFVNKSPGIVTIQSGGTIRTKNGLPLDLGNGATAMFCLVDAVWYQM